MPASETKPLSVPEGCVQKVFNSEMHDGLTSHEWAMLNRVKTTVVSCIYEEIAKLQSRYLAESDDPDESGQVRFIAHTQLCECASILKLLTGYDSLRVPQT